MFRKVHFRLTLLFTFVSSILLLIMSCLYLYISYSSVKSNAFVSFQSDMNTFVTNCENRSVISYDWLLKLESSKKYSFYLYDNNVPFSFVNNTKSKEERELADRVRSFYQETYAAPGENMYASYHTEFPYSEKGKGYYAGVGIIPGKSSNLEIVVLYSLDSIQKQMNRLYLQFACIILATVGAIWIFSWYYTKHLLHPIEESQTKQIQFIASASHELRTPVATILSALGAMEKGDEKEQKEFVKIARKEGERLSLLVDEMLTLARSDNHSFPLHMSEVELDTLLLDCYEAFLAPAREKDIKLSIELPKEDISKCEADPDRIRQVIGILLSNAISYSGGNIPENTSGGRLEQGQIQIKLMEMDHAFQIRIIDNGMGISDQDKPHIFDRFYRADASRNDREHFGLGLCIAKEIVGVHHGKIEVMDTPGGGSTFVVELRNPDP